jgi:hypothetical protein
VAGAPAHPQRQKIDEMIMAGAATAEIVERTGAAERTVQTRRVALLGPQKRSTRKIQVAPSRRPIEGNPNSSFERAEHRATALGGSGDRDPVRMANLSVEAARALQDFELFRRRYFGRVSVPWQVVAGAELVRLLESPEDERVVINCPPGAGKSTLIHDVTCWMICRDRAVRILIVSASQRLAEKYSLRIRRSLERRFPVKASTRELARGLAVHAEATLAGDYGRFRPPSESLWRKEEYVVEQLNGEALENKEPTVAAYGLDSDVIGHRADAVLPDDLATPGNAKEGQERNALLERWEVIENRVEPGGLLAVTGQRLSPVDLSQHCLDQLLGDDDDENDDGRTELGAPQHMYRHIVYRAYYPELDAGVESRSPLAPPWPNGPLLDPKRVTWKKLAALQRGKPGTYATQYQQERGATTDDLVQEVWVTGGFDERGAMYPGCVDPGRRLWEIPRFDDRDGPVLSVGSIDPGVAKNWAFIWLLYQPETDMRHIVGLHCGPMSADSVLSWDVGRRECAGLMVDWQARSKDAGYPISHWVIERNIGRHFLDLAPIASFQIQSRATVVQHATHRYNKDHADLGIQVLIPPIWREGHIRLPDRINPQVERFIQEHLTWRIDKRSDTDQVMAAWFPELHWPTIRPAQPLPRMWTPSWLEPPLMGAAS